MNDTPSLSLPGFDDNPNVAEARNSRDGNRLHVLARSNSTWVRGLVAENGHTKAVTLRLLATDREAVVRAGVAGNSRVPVDLLEFLAYDQDELVRQAVHGNVLYDRLPELFRVEAALFHLGAD